MVAASSSALGGCVATLKSTPLTGCASSDCPAPAGFVYSLPKGQFYFQASRLPVTNADVTAAATALGAANTVVKKDLAGLATDTATQATDTGKKASADTLAADQAAIDGDNRGLVADQAILGAAQDAFNRALAGLGEGTETFTISPLQIVPDPSARFTASLNHIATRDDTLKIDGSNGLLTSANTSSTDQGLNSLVSLLQTGISLAVFASSGIPIVPKAGPPAAPGVKPPTFPLACTYQIADYFDPLNPADVTRINDELTANHATMRLVVITTSDTPAAAAAASGSADRNPAKLLPPTPRSGLFYRTATTAIVTVRPVEGLDKDSPNHTAWTGADQMWADGGPSLDAMTLNPIACPLVAKPIALSQLAVLPDSRTQFRVDADAGPFTTTTHSYAFVNGMLTEHQVSRPSEVVAPVQALNTLAQDVIAIPGSIVTLRLNFANSSDQLLKAQTTLYSDRLNVLTSAYNAKAAVDNAEASFVTAQFATPEAYMTAQTNLLKAQQALQTLIDSQTPPSASSVPLPAAASPLPTPKSTF